MEPMSREEAEAKAAALLDRWLAMHPTAKGKLRTAEKYNLLHEIADGLLAAYAEGVSDCENEHTSSLDI